MRNDDLNTITQTYGKAAADMTEWMLNELQAREPEAVVKMEEALNRGARMSLVVTTDAALQQEIGLDVVGIDGAHHRLLTMSARTLQRH